MNEMIERVAAVIRSKFFNGAWPPSMEDDLGMDAEGWREAARAAILAMREPTFDMANLICNDEDAETEDGAERWRYAIDEALR